jgi:hypothetical protein
MAEAAHGAVDAVRDRGVSGIEDFGGNRHPDEGAHGMSISHFYMRKRETNSAFGMLERSNDSVENSSDPLLVVAAIRSRDGCVLRNPAAPGDSSCQTDSASVGFLRKQYSP